MNLKNNILKKYILNKKELDILSEMEKLNKIDDDSLVRKDNIAAEQLKIENAINNIEDLTERMVLQMMYILNFKIDDVALKLNYSNSQIYRIKRKALEKLKLNDN